MDWLTERPIAHRGLHSAGVPENSIAAVRAAVDAGYAVEVDVRLSADGVPVVFHDSDCARLTERSEAVADLDWATLSELRLDGTEETVPSLDAVLDAIDGEVPLLVELKPDGWSRDLERAVAARLDEYDGAFAVQSFDPFALRWFRRNRPAWPRGQLASSFEGTSLPAHRRAVCKRLLLNWASRPDFLGYDHADLPYWPVTLHRRLGVPVLAWTVRTEADLERARRHADNVIFEDVRPAP